VGTGGAAPSERERLLDEKGLVVDRIASSEGSRYVFSGRCRSSEPSFVEELDRLRGRIVGEAGPVALDLAGLELANSAFVGLVVGLVASLDERGRRLAVIGPSRQVQDLLGVVGILGALEIRPGRTA
jgi:ABC-type transporter Mla MlaB component